MKDRSATGQDLQKCARCKMSWYCSRECQKEHWQIHKKKCEDVEGTGLSRLVRKLQSNKWLLFLLEVCVVCNSDLLRRKSDPDRPFMARINVGIEPTDISVCYQLFTGAEFESEMEGMLQLNAVTPLEDPGPLAPHMMPLWNNFREVTNGLGFSSDAVGLLEFVNTSDHSITTSIHITQPALEYAQAAKPFRGHSALFGVSEVPFSAMSCLEQINSHIRSDSKNLLQLRVL
ncbi:hypothetical protein M413DRAFT_387664 [Hebeloma cylindrosporum]|uniref:MYND-type domain-containing protein n=1 Tax=Hebeloma cylindrosporum TaxID=76867 RepID=A0A0C2YRT7_HEBCY|nr:hypothetical protein M413DRAFT_387664 [Hebeloma cylindrosporum h7]